MAIIVGGLASAAFFAFELSGKIDELREVPRDNIQWNTAQLEVDFLKLRAALQAASEDPDLLGEFRKQYDVFYSRIRILDGATETLSLDENPALRANQHDLQHFLMLTEPLADLPDAALLAALPEFAQRLDVIRNAPREFALGAVQVMAGISDAQRMEIIGLLRNLAIVTLSVIAALVLSLAGMTFQRLELSRRAAAITQAGRMRESTLRASLDAIVVIDEKGRVTDFNGSAEKIFGFARDEILGKTLAEAIVPERFRNAHDKGFAQYTVSERSNIVDKGRLELVALHKDGHEFPIELSITETSGATGPNFVSYIRDITEEKNARAELQKARDDALAASREKSRFFAVMSHEMRTPLNGIMSAMDLMRDDPLTEKQERYVAIANSSSQVLLSHVDDVLLIERLDSGENSGHATSFHPGAVIDELADTMRPLAQEQNTVLVCEKSGADGCVIGDARALRQVVMNLMSNAIKFTPSGTVTLRIVSTPAPDDTVKLVVSVTDTGIGISEEDQTRIFEDFVTVDSPYERNASGTGLGLGIVRRLVGNMNGTVTCLSKPGQGTTFTVSVTLPRATQADAHVASAPDRRHRGAARALEILVVEDNPINAEVLEAMLLREGHRVALARDGFEGVHMASKSYFDLILMDVSMPNMNGIKATQQIRASRGLSHNTPIYAVTAHAMPKEIEEFLSAGMSGCVPKPINPARLRDILDRVSAAVPGRDDRADTPDAIAPVSAQGADAAGMVDHAELDELSDLLGKDKLLSRLARFVEEGDKTIDILRDARQTDDLSELQNHAHRLAGACAVFGAVAVHRDLQALEAACKDGAARQADAHVASVEITWQATRATLQEVIARG